jgi:hypothetical protein
MRLAQILVFPGSIGWFLRSESTYELGQGIILRENTAPTVPLPDGLSGTHLQNLDTIFGEDRDLIALLYLLGKTQQFRRLTNFDIFYLFVKHGIPLSGGSWKEYIIPASAPSARLPG